VDESEVWSSTTAVSRSVFGDDEIVLTRETAAKDIDAWDSLTHVQLVVAIEELFRIRLTTGEVGGLKNVGQLVDLIRARIR
jgi:acyl carrier protein